MEYNLTKPQYLIYNMEKNIGGIASIICGSMLLNSKFSKEEMLEAAKKLYNINSALRIRVKKTEKGVVQFIDEEMIPNVTYMEFDSVDELYIYAEKYARKSFDEFGILSEFTVIKVENRCGLLVKMHHLISDAWSIALLGKQFISLLQGESIDAYSYFEYIDTEKKYLNGKRFQKDKEYFLKVCDNFKEIVHISDKEAYQNCVMRNKYEISVKQKELLDKFVVKNKISLYCLFMTALGIYISKISNKNKFYVGTTILNRSGHKEKNTIGMFVNTIPICIEICNDDTTLACLSKMSDTLSECMRHQRYNYNDVIKLYREKYGNSNLLFDVVLNYQNAKIESNVETKWYCSGSQVESLQIHIDDRDNNGILSISYDYQIEKFTSDEIDLLHNRLLLIINELLNEGKYISEIDYIPKNEKNKILYDFNFSKKNLSQENLYNMLFEKSIKYNDLIAIIDKGRKYTYYEIKELTDLISKYLIKNTSKKSDTFIVVCMPKSMEFVVSLLAIIKSGMAYIPVDPEMPKDRLEFMIHDCEAEIVLDLDLFSQILQEKTAYFNEVQEKVHITSDTLCYAIYTSGSTGKPKMVGISHSNLESYIHNLHELYGTNKINMPFFTNQAVDLTVTSIYLPLTTGGCIYVYDGDIHTVMKNITENEELNILKMTPTHMQILNNYISGRIMKNIKHVILGGESLLVLDTVKFLNKFGKHITIHNEYGPTETTVGCANYVFSNSDINKNIVSIGHPFAGTKLYILDKNNDILPIGCIGELCISGMGVGLGYLKNKELSEEKFINNPFGNGKLYKTGDLAYWQTDGNIMCIGRMDFQVKIHGRRIELGEIEKAIQSIDEVKQVVVDVKSVAGTQYLCAYYVAKTIVDQKLIKRVLTSKLPHYMIPKFYMKVDRIPIGFSGKTDKTSLPAPKWENSSEEYVLPKTWIQKILCDVAKEVLEVENFGIKQDFFEYGGDSLTALEFLAIIESKKIGKIDLQMIFDNPTMETLAEAINGKGSVRYYDEDFEKCNNILKSNFRDSEFIPKKNDYKNVLLTGTTGFLGSHILYELLSTTDCVIYCLLHSIDTKDIKGHFIETLYYYFGDEVVNEIGKRIIPIIGDITNDSSITELPNYIDTVIHCAATVKHYGKYEYFEKVNVLGTKNIALYASKIKANFIHISTISVFGENLNKENSIYSEFTENNFYVGQRLDNVYIRSKFEAERVIYAFIEKGELNANIIRVGNLCNRISDYKFQPNYAENAFLNRIRSIFKMKCFPNTLLDYECEFSPVDDVSKAIVAILNYFNTHNFVFNLNSNSHVTFRDIFKIADEHLGIKVNFVSEKKFQDLIKKSALSEDAYIYKSFINDFDSNGHFLHGKTIVNNDKTIMYLKRIGFEWSEISNKYIIRYIKYFNKLNYFEL